MGEYVSKKKDMNFKSLDSLENVTRVIKEADAALNDKSRTIKTSAISEVLAGAAGAVAGGTIGFAALYAGGTVAGLSAAGITSGLAAAGGLIGGGMVAGVAVLAAPAVALTAAGVGIASNLKNKKLREAKELCYKNAVAKQNAIIKALQEESRSNRERIEYLTGLNNLLNAAVRDLKHDLGI